MIQTRIESNQWSDIRGCDLFGEFHGLWSDDRKQTNAGVREESPPQVCAGRLQREANRLIRDADEHTRNRHRIP